MVLKKGDGGGKVEKKEYNKALIIIATQRNCFKTKRRNIDSESYRKGGKKIVICNNN